MFGSLVRGSCHHDSMPCSSPWGFVDSAEGRNCRRAQGRHWCDAEIFAGRVRIAVVDPYDFLHVEFTGRIDRHRELRFDASECAARTDAGTRMGRRTGGRPAPMPPLNMGSNRTSARRSAPDRGAATIGTRLFDKKRGPDRRPVSTLAARLPRSRRTGCQALLASAVLHLAGVSERPD